MTKKKPKLLRKTGKTIMRNLKENNLYYENKQITQCVFLGVLKLKPVPSIFRNNIKPNVKSIMPKPIKLLKNIKNNNNVKAFDKVDNKKTGKKQGVSQGRITKKNVDKIRAKKREPKKVPIKIKLPPKKKESNKDKQSSSKQKIKLPNIISSPIISPIGKQTYKIINSPRKLLSVIKESTPPKKCDEMLLDSPTFIKNPVYELIKANKKQTEEKTIKSEEKVLKTEEKPVKSKEVKPKKIEKNAPSPSSSKSEPAVTKRAGRKKKSTEKGDEASPPKSPKLDSEKKPNKSKGRSKSLPAEIILINDDENDANKTNIVPMKQQDDDVIYISTEVSPRKLGIQAMNTLLKMNSPNQKQPPFQTDEVIVIVDDTTDKIEKRTSPRIKNETVEEKTEVKVPKPKERTSPRLKLENGNEDGNVKTRRSLRNKVKNEQLNVKKDEPRVTRNVYQDPNLIVEQLARITGCTGDKINQICSEPTIVEFTDDLVLEIPSPNFKIEDVKPSPRLLRSNAQENADKIEIQPTTKKKGRKSKVVVLDDAKEASSDVEIIANKPEQNKRNPSTTKVARVKPMMLLTEALASATKDLYEFDDSEMNEVVVLRTPSPKKTSPKSAAKPTLRSSPKQLFVDDANDVQIIDPPTKPTLRSSPKEVPAPTATQKKRGKPKQTKEVTVKTEGAVKVLKTGPKSKRQKSPQKNGSPLKQQNIKEMFDAVKVKKERQAEIDAVFARPEQLSPNENLNAGQRAKSDNVGKSPLAQTNHQLLNNEDCDEDYDDDTRSHLEWMPDDYAEYTFKYSAKKMDTYRSLHKCKVCLLRFPSYYTLNKHKIIHLQDENPYQCTTCQESFKDVDTFNAHLRIHKESTPPKKCDEMPPCVKNPVHNLPKAKKKQTEEKTTTSEEITKTPKTSAKPNDLKKKIEKNVPSPRKKKYTEKLDETPPAEPLNPNSEKKPNKTKGRSKSLPAHTVAANDGKTNVVPRKRRNDDVIYVSTDVSPKKLGQETLDTFLKITSPNAKRLPTQTDEVIVIGNETTDTIEKRTSPRIKNKTVEENPEVSKLSKETSSLLKIDNGNDDNDLNTRRILRSKDDREIPSPIVKVEDFTPSPGLTSGNAQVNVDKIETASRRKGRKPKVMDDANAKTEYTKKNSATKVARVRPMMLLTEPSASTTEDLCNFDDSEMNKVVVVRTLSPKKTSPKSATKSTPRSSPEQLLVDNANDVQIIDPPTKSALTSSPNTSTQKKRGRPKQTKEVTVKTEGTVKVLKTETIPAAASKTKTQKLSQPNGSPLKQQNIKDMFDAVRIKQEKLAEVDAVFARPNEHPDAGKLTKGDNVEKSPLKQTNYRPFNEEDCEDDDDDDTRSHLEWMPDDYAEYTFKYSAKKMDAYRSLHKCKVCLLRFPSYYTLNKHKIIHLQDENPYQCTTCQETFKDVDTFNAHLRIHKGKEPYNCKKCHKAFRKIKELEEHEPIHIKKSKPANKRFRCDVCAREFGKLSDMERHTRVHTGEKPSQCNICHKRFQQSYNLSKHLITHLHVRPFQCDICNKQFGRNDVLNRHLLTHSVKKPFKCQVPHCNKEFIRNAQLTKHVANVHKDIVKSENNTQVNGAKETLTSQ